MFEQSKPIFGLVKLTPYHEVHIYTQGKICVEYDISAYEYSKIRVRKCSALSQKQRLKKRDLEFKTSVIRVRLVNRFSIICTFV
jgi:hypothetical protein